LKNTGKYQKIPLKIPKKIPVFSVSKTVFFAVFPGIVAVFFGIFGGIFQNYVFLKNPVNIDFFLT